MVFYYTLVADIAGRYRNPVGQICREQKWLGGTAGLPVPCLCNDNWASQWIPANVVFRLAEPALA